MAKVSSSKRTSRRDASPQVPSSISFDDNGQAPRGSGQAPHGSTRPPLAPIAKSKQGKVSQRVAGTSVAESSRKASTGAAKASAKTPSRPSSKSTKAPPNTTKPPDADAQYLPPNELGIGKVAFSKININSYKSGVVEKALDRLVAFVEGSYEVQPQEFKEKISLEAAVDLFNKKFVLKLSEEQLLSAKCYKGHGGWLRTYIYGGGTDSSSAASETDMEDSGSPVKKAKKKQAAGTKSRSYPEPNANSSSGSSDGSESAESSSAKSTSVVSPPKKGSAASKSTGGSLAKKSTTAPKKSTASSAAKKTTVSSAAKKTTVSSAAKKTPAAASAKKSATSAASKKTPSAAAAAATKKTPSTSSRSRAVGNETRASDVDEGGDIDEEGDENVAKRAKLEYKRVIFKPDELEHFYAIMKAVKPRGNEDWQTVLRRHVRAYPDNHRTIESLNRRFLLDSKKKGQSGQTNTKRYEQLAQEASELIEAIDGTKAYSKSDLGLQDAVGVDGSSIDPNEEVASNVEDHSNFDSKEGVESVDLTEDVSPSSSSKRKRLGKKARERKKRKSLDYTGGGTGQLIMSRRPAASPQSSPGGNLYALIEAQGQQTNSILLAQGQQQQADRQMMFDRMAHESQMLRDNNQAQEQRLRMTNEAQDQRQQSLIIALLGGQARASSRNDSSLQMPVHQSYTTPVAPAASFSAARLERQNLSPGHVASSPPQYFPTQDNQSNNN